MSHIYWECSICRPSRIPQDVPAIQKRPKPFPAGSFPNLSQTPRVVYADFLALGPNVDVSVPIRAFRATIPPHVPQVGRRASARHGDVSSPSLGETQVSLCDHRASTVRHPDNSCSVLVKDDKSLKSPGSGNASPVHPKTFK